jgi:hypothetical protein
MAMKPGEKGHKNIVLNHCPNYNEYAGKENMKAI